MYQSYQGPGLYDFLAEAELQQYYGALKVKLKVQNVPQLKYVTDEDLLNISMSKPEIKRLKKYYTKYNPNSCINKIKSILKKRENVLENNEETQKSTKFKSPIKVHSKHIIPPDAIVVHKELGAGEFGVVQQGVWTDEEGNRRQVAIKCLNKECMNNDSWRFLKEAVIMHSIDHEHIVRLYGIVLEEKALMLVTELAPLRSLLECLKEPSIRPNFSIMALSEFSSQICDGMQYLESKRLIHRDLAARNILVFLKNRVKISDFGLSRALGVGKDYYQTNFNVNLKLPIAWCAPECINYLKFTSASDVWAFGVTLWEMFSYGFQPWAALTGQQILTAIDTPNNQRLDCPELCPKEIYAIMIQCWQHNPQDRPKFSSLMHLLLDARPMLLQAIQPNDPDCDMSYLKYKSDDIITVLDKNPINNDSELWKGALSNGKTGLFKADRTIAYFGTNIPSPCNFNRRDGQSAYASKRRLKPEMISQPQGDFKHTSHVGLDGAYFGDVSFLNGKYHQLPRKGSDQPAEVKTEANPSSSRITETADVSDKAPLLCKVDDKSKTDITLDTECPLASVEVDVESIPESNVDHEYHEIPDEKILNFGPSLFDEIMSAIKTNPKITSVLPKVPEIIVEDSKEQSIKTTKKRHSSVKTISPSEEKTMDEAIIMAQKLADKSMAELNEGGSSEKLHVVSHTVPVSPTRSFFNFKFSQRSSANPKEDNKNINIQDTISHEAKKAYNTLVDEPVIKSLTTSSLKNSFEEPSLLHLTDQEEEDDSSPLRLLKQGYAVRPKIPGNKYRQCMPIESQAKNVTPRTSVLQEGGALHSLTNNVINNSNRDAHPIANVVNSVYSQERENHLHETNSKLPPLPPKTKNSILLTEKQRHHRKYPLVIPIADNNSVGQDSEIPKESPCEGEETVKSVSTDNLAINPDLNMKDSVDEMSPMHKNLDHVSCEDLLEFACDRPNTKRTQGRARGTSADEVRVVQKVLANKASLDDCVKALNTTNWQVYQAIKLLRLRSILDSNCLDTHNVPLEELRDILILNDWDLQSATKDF